MDCMPRGVWAIVACHHANAFQVKSVLNFVIVRNDKYNNGDDDNDDDHDLFYP